MAKKLENYTPIPTPEKQLKYPSGFCMTGHHENCKHQFDHGKCGCTCHGPVVIPKRRGRPPGSKNKPKG